MSEENSMNKAAGEAGLAASPGIVVKKKKKKKPKILDVVD